MAQQYGYGGYAGYAPVDSYPTGGGSTAGVGYQSPYANTQGQSVSSFFDSPTQQPILSAWNDRMSQLAQPSPGFGDLSGLIRSQLSEDPRFSAAISGLGTIGNSAPTGNAYTSQYAAAVAKRNKELNADPFSSADEAALKARFLDSTAHSRDQAIDQISQSMSSRGFAPTSGIASDAFQTLQGQYEQAQAGQRQAMTQYVTDERNRRRDLAVTEAQGLASQGGQDAATANSAIAARGSMLGAMLSALGSARGQNMAGIGQLANMRQQGYENEQTRGQNRLQTSMLPYSLETEALQGAQGSLNANSPSADQITQLLMTQYGMSLSQAQAQASRFAALFGGIANAGAPVLNTVAQHYLGT